MRCVGNEKKPDSVNHTQLTDQSIACNILPMVDKRTQLIESSIELFANNGFWNTPTSKIAKHAGVATGTLFNYFPTKEALIDAVYLQLKRELSERLQQELPHGDGVKVCQEHVWYRYIDWAVRNPTRYTLVHQLKLSQLVSEEAQQQQAEEFAFMSRLLQQGVQEALFADISAAYIGTVALAQLEAAVSYAMHHQLQDMQLAKHIAQSFAIFWNGVAR